MEADRFKCGYDLLAIVGFAFAGTFGSAVSALEIGGNNKIPNEKRLSRKQCGNLKDDILKLKVVRPFLLG
jgi:hypothetical protein